MLQRKLPKGGPHDQRHTTHAAARNQPDQPRDHPRRSARRLGRLSPRTAVWVVLFSGLCRRWGDAVSGLWPGWGIPCAYAPPRRISSTQSTSRPPFPLLSPALLTQSSTPAHQKVGRCFPLIDRHVRSHTPCEQPLMMISVAT